MTQRFRIQNFIEVNAVFLANRESIWMQIQILALIASQVMLVIPHSGKFRHRSVFKLITNKILLKKFFLK